MFILITLLMRVNTIPFLVDSCLKNGIHILSVTDHNNMNSYAPLVEYAKEHYSALKIIPSEEISTKQGSIIAMFLKEPVPGWLDIKETIHIIKDQGAVIYLPRPYQFFNKIEKLGNSTFQMIMDNVDILEGFNSHNLSGNTRASWYAREKNKLILWGANAHFSYEIMNCIVSIPDFDMNKDSFLESVKKASLLFKRASYRGVLNSYMLKKRMIKNNYRKRL